MRPTFATRMAATRSSSFLLRCIESAFSAVFVRRVFFVSIRCGAERCSSNSSSFENGAPAEQIYQTLRKWNSNTSLSHTKYTHTVWNLRVFWYFVYDLSHMIQIFEIYDTFRWIEHLVLRLVRPRVHWKRSPIRAVFTRLVFESESYGFAWGFKL